MAQIAALEAEMAKVQKQLDAAKATYSSLQKQYNEQCRTHFPSLFPSSIQEAHHYLLSEASEKYRDDLRKREDAIRTLREAAALHEIETHKWQREHETYEDRINQLELELSSALEAHTHLDEQKQENLLLKETIDRMRFEMDEMRNAASSNTLLGSGHSSAANSMSKSLGAELAGKMMSWDMDPEGEGDSGEIMMSPETTVVDEDETEVEEDEDVIQTIITKRKRVRSIRFFFSSMLPFNRHSDLHVCRKYQVERQSCIPPEMLLRSLKSTRTARHNMIQPFSLSTTECRPSQSVNPLKRLSASKQTQYPNQSPYPRLRHVLQSRWTSKPILSKKNRSKSQNRNISRAWLHHHLPSCLPRRNQAPAKSFLATHHLRIIRSQRRTKKSASGAWPLRR